MPKSFSIRNLRMAFVGSCLMALAGAMLTALPVEGRSLYAPESKGQYLQKDATCNPYPTIRIHDRGLMGLSITNHGQIGLGFSAVEEDPTNPGVTPPSLIYPYPGDKNHLWGGAIWVGAVVNGDTLVSTGADGWFVVTELWPGTQAGNGDILEYSIDPPGDPEAVSHQDYVARYTDTLTNPTWCPQDPIDNRPHVPLKIEIVQSSHVWDYNDSRDFVIYNCNIKNIGSYFLEDVHIGVFMDGDVHQVDDITGYSDDLAGFRESGIFTSACGWPDTIDLAYIFDNEGLGGGQTCPYTENSLTEVTGIRLLAFPGYNERVNFNWWVSNGNAALDFGPRLAGTPEDPFFDFGGFLGTPSGDRNKYYMLSHEERDYDQIYTGRDNSADGWLPPTNYLEDFVNGSDAKYLLSFGPIDINPGNVANFAFAVVGGENFHTDCYAFSNLFDPEDPSAFYETLDFTDIGRNAVYAGWYYDNPGYDTDGDGYLGKFRICCIDSSFINGEWSCTVADTEYYEGDGVPDLRPFKPHVSPFIDPAQLHWADGNLVHPESVLIYIDDDYYYLHPDDVNPATVRVNGLVPNDVYVGTHPVLGKPALVAEVDKSDFVESYGIIWGGDPHPYQVTGNHNSGMPFDIEGQVMIVGHIPGDVNADKRVDVLDVIYLVDYKFHHGTPPRPFPEIGDVDASGGVNILDMIYLVNYLFKGGPAPRHP